jgi:sugar-phosphatase
MASSVAASPVLIRCRGILFDMDGILISSLGSVERSWTKWANLRGIDPAYACRMTHGCRSIETVAKLRPDLDAEAENRIIE